MEIVNSNKGPNENSVLQSLFISNESFEIVVIEDKKLINMLLGKTLQSAIERICDLKKFPIKFSSFQSESLFINYLENKEFGKTNLIVFTDRSFEKELNNAGILFMLKQKGIDLKMIVMSENSENQSTGKIFKNEFQDLIPDQKTNSAVSSQQVEKVLI